MSDYQTPHKDGEVDKSLDEEDDLNDRENAEEFLARDTDGDSQYPSFEAA